MTELALLLDYSERPRVDDWSLRSALTRYAQPQPARVGALLELVRRIEFGLKPHVKALEKGDVPDDPLVAGLLDAMRELDAVGDRLASWATDPFGAEPPDAEVDRAIASVAKQLDAVGAPHETRERPPPRARKRG